jgi:hypothetical protein
MCCLIKKKKAQKTPSFFDMYTRKYYTASDKDVKLKFCTRIGGTMLLPMRTGFPITSTLASMAAGLSLKRKFLTACLLHLSPPGRCHHGLSLSQPAFADLPCAHSKSGSPDAFFCAFYQVFSDWSEPCMIIPFGGGTASTFFCAAQ